MELSKRLQAVADLVSDGLIVADIGTDHGYIPIYLLTSKKCPKAYAMDVNKGPLLRAKEHVEAYGLGDKIETRLSDGVNNLYVGECDCVVIAGMGGALTIKIMEEGKTLFQNLKEFVLQPQSEIKKVRQYLQSEGYRVIAEDMVYEEGKFYPMMKVIKDTDEAYHATELQYGKLLLSEKHPILKMFLEKEYQKKKRIFLNLENEIGAHIDERREEIKVELEGIEYALQRYHESD